MNHENHKKNYLPKQIVGCTVTSHYYYVSDGDAPVIWILYSIYIRGGGDAESGSKVNFVSKHW